MDEYCKKEGFVKNAQGKTPHTNRLHQKNGLNSNVEYGDDGRSRLLFKVFPLPTYAWKREGDDFFLFDYNDAAEKATFGNIVSFKNVPLTDFYKDNNQVILDIHQCFHEKRSLQKEMEYRYVSTEKTEYISITYTYIPPDIVLVYMHDITAWKKAEDELKSREELFRALIEGLSEAVVVVDEHGAINLINKGAETIFGYKKEEMLGMIVDMLLPEDLRNGHASFRHEYMKNPISRPMGSRRELVALRKDGQKFPVEIALNVIFPEDKPVVIALVSDITDRKQLEKDLAESTERWLFALEGSNQGVWDWNLETGEIFISRNLKEMIGIEPDIEITHIDQWAGRIHPEDLHRWREAVDDHCHGKKPFYSDEHRILFGDGSYRWVLARGKIMSWTPDDKPLRIVGTLSDIAERKRAEELLEKAAKTDMLTGLSNRLEFNEHFDIEESRYGRTGRPFSIILGDIDFFKKVNDTYGHDCGDFVLMKIADMLRVTTRKQDTIGRWGGEELILLLPETDIDQAGILAEKIRAKIAESAFVFKGFTFSITMSFGVSVYTPGLAKDDIIKNADEKLYTAKKTGRNRVVI